MRCGHSLARAAGLAACLAVAALAPALAQEAAPAPVASPILTIDQERLFVESAFGRAVLARETATASALATENADIEAKLVAQELDLTERRATLSAEGDPVRFFGLEIPALLAPDKILSGQLEELHEIGGTIGYFLLGGHALLSIIHHAVFKDTTLIRMMPSRPAH